MKIIEWLFRREPDRVSLAWVQAKALEDTKTGWVDAPRWRLPKEREPDHAA